MTPAARVQAAIELLDAVVTAAKDGGPAADVLIQRYFATRRYAGSGDRRGVRELVYAAIRLCGERPASGRAAMLALVAERPELAAQFNGAPHCPAPIAPDEPVAMRGLMPVWIEKRLVKSGVDAATRAGLLERAPLDLRVNRLVAGWDDVAAELGGVAVPGAPDALRLDADAASARGEAVESGRVEVQDAGSQIVTRAAGAAPGMRVVDLCAGAGGKTLAMAALMANRGAIIACDIDRTRLSRLPMRAQRAGVTIATTRLLDPGREAAALGDIAGTADLVLVDAPCSGTGTWRRNPEARWRLTPARLDRLAEAQAKLLDIAAGLIRPGGAVVYIVCSLLDSEGADQAEAFLTRRVGWAAVDLPDWAGLARGPGRRLDPHHHSTDGFFVAKMVAPC